MSGSTARSAAQRAAHAANRQKGERMRRAIADAIAAYWDLHRYGPAIRDIQALVGLGSTSVVAHHLGVMEREGTITRDPMVSRSIRLVAR